ncbi:MAG: 50S ribosomal protein L18 [Candidatus Walczuchella monophlebidarum]
MYKKKNKIFGTSERPRLSIYRSNKDIFAQVIDDFKGITLSSATSKEKKFKIKVSKTKKATLVGKILGEKTLKLGISRVVFDRNGYLYHGRVKALAEAARKEGLEF